MPADRRPTIQDMEEQEMSKKSQAENKKVAAALKGQAEAAKNGRGRPRKEKIPYMFKPLAATFVGIAGKATMDGRLLAHVPLHMVEDGKTLCGYSTRVATKGLTHYELNWQAAQGPTTCARCLKAAEKPAGETPKAKKPTPKKAVAAKI